jgi:uncharacterized protein
MARAGTVRADGGASPERKAVRPRPVALVLIGLIRGYQYCLSPWLGGQCRFVPTCSQYALEAVRRHGALRGSWLTLKRLARCRPGGGSGYDPVDAESFIEH